MSISGSFASTAKTDWTRYLRSPALWFVALAAPIAAHYMVPDKEAAYAVLTINKMIPRLSPSGLGLELGVLTATLLTPLAYIFLRAGPTRHRPWQVSDVAPHSRMVVTLGRWVSDTAALWVLLGCLTLAGLILGIFRLEDDANVLKTICALWLPAAPSLALIAAIRLFLDARNLTRRWLGDVIFFILWIMLLMSGMIGSFDSETGFMISRPFVDPFGFTSPIVGSADYPVSGVTIGGSANANTGETVAIEAWRGVTDIAYVSSRVFWLAIAAGLATLAGLIWAPMKTRPTAILKNKKGMTPEAQKSASISETPFRALAPIHSKGQSLTGLLVSEIRLILRSKVWLILLVAAALAGFNLPFRTAAAPAILLALIFPLSEEASRWDKKTTVQLLDTMGPSRIQRIGGLLTASMLIALAAFIPSLGKVIMSGEYQALKTIAIIVIGAPAVIIGLGALTRNAVAGRLIMLIAWYVFLSSASP
ncbi:MAG: hypothetical protein ABJN69_02480 [Hellea sp.]